MNRGRSSAASSSAPWRRSSCASRAAVAPADRWDAGLPPQPAADPCKMRKKGVSVGCKNPKEKQTSGKSLQISLGYCFLIPIKIKGVNSIPCSAIAPENAETSHLKLGNQQQDLGCGRLLTASQSYSPSCAMRLRGLVPSHRAPRRSTGHQAPLPELTRPGRGGFTNAFPWKDATNIRELRMVAGSSWVNWNGPPSQNTP